MCTHGFTPYYPLASTGSALTLPGIKAKLLKFAAMQAIGFYLLLPFLYFFSVLPMFMLRQLSNVAFFIMYRITGYRREVVMRNLRNSFPDKSEKELQKLARSFYLYLSDTLVETIKSFTISDRGLRKHCAIHNYDIVQQEIDKGRNVMFVLGHYGNWEWGGGALAKRAPIPLKAAYKPLSNPYFEKLMFRTRSRLNIWLIPKRKLLTHLKDHSDQQTLLVLIADQSPNPKEHFWVDFMHQDTAVVTGMEKIAKQYNYVVIYSTIANVGRNRYEIRFKKITDDAPSLPPVALTQMFMHELEQDIRMNPAPYLWSHRRWKLKKPVA